MNYSMRSILSLFLLGGVLYAREEKVDTVKAFRTQICNNIINYNDFKNSCDVLFEHAAGNEGVLFDPKWFRGDKEEKNSYQKIIYSNAPFDPSLVQPGDMVFVRRPRIFLETIHPQIKNPYIIVTHGNSSSRFKKPYMAALNDPTIIAWFTIHSGNKKHPKLHPLPLGIRQFSRFLNKKGDNLRQLRKSLKKRCLLYMNFLDRTHPERAFVRQLFQDKPFCFNEGKVDFETFMYHMANSKFTLAPRGVGAADSFRIWESLMVGSIPIIKRSKFMDNSLYTEMPVLIVDKWETVTEEFLRETYKTMSTVNYSTDKLYMRYWLDQIYKVRDSFLEKNNLIRNGTD